MKKQVSKEDLASLCLELSLLLHAGVGTGDALHLLAEEEESSRELLERLAEQVDEGAPLHAALRESGAGHLQILLDFGAEGMVRSEGAYNVAPLDPAGDA